MNTYNLDQQVRFSVSISNLLSVAVDPDDVYFQWRRPDTKIISTYHYGVDPELVRDSIGNYHADVTLDFPGEWPYRFYWTGTYVGAAENKCCVRDSVF